MKKVSLRDLDFKNLSAKAGFTWTETRVLLFLVFSILMGYAYSIISSEKSTSYKSYDYSKEDSLFYSLYNSDLENSKPKETYKSEIFTSVKNGSIKTKPDLPLENSININSASAEELTALPGIGEKTAKSIIDFRNKNGNFKSIEDILNVRGIKEGKLRKIKPYIFIK